MLSKKSHYDRELMTGYSDDSFGWEYLLPNHNFRSLSPFEGIYVCSSSASSANSRVRRYRLFSPFFCPYFLRFAVFIRRMDPDQ